MLPSFHLSAFDIYCAITQYIDYCNRPKAVMSFHSIMIYHTTAQYVYKRQEKHITFIINIVVIVIIIIINKYCVINFLQKVAEDHVEYAPIKIRR